jgi:hypothetical protein
MMRMRRLVLGAVGFILLAGAPVSAAPAPAASAKGSPLAHVPAQSPIVIHVRGLDRTKGRLLAMIKNALPNYGQKAADHLDELVKQGIEGRQLKGLAKDGPIFFAFTEMPKPGVDIPMVAMILKVTSYQEFRDGALKEDERKNLKKESGYEVASIDNQDVYFVDKDGYAVVTPRKEVAVQFTKKQPGLDGELDAVVAKKILESDLSVYVDMAAVNKEFGEQITAGKQLMEVGLQQAGAQLDEATLELVKGIFGGIFQVIEDAKGLLLTGELRPEGLAFQAQVRVGADSKTNKYLKGAKPSALKEIAKLPADQMMYMGIEFDPELAKFYLPLLQKGVGGKAGKGFKEALDQMVAAGLQSLVMDFNFPIGGLQVSNYKDPAKAVQSQLQLIKSLEAGQNFQNAVIKDKPQVKENAETHRDFKLNSVSITWDFEKMAENNPGGKDLADAMKKLMGEEMKYWFGTDGKTVVQVVGKDWASAQKRLDAYLDGKATAGEQKTFQEARKQLPEQATLLALIDAPQYLQVMASVIGPIVKAQGLPIQIPELKASKGKGYMGMAFTLQPEQGSFDFWIPGSAVREIYKMVQPLIPGAEEIQ